MPHRTGSSSCNYAARGRIVGPNLPLGDLRDKVGARAQPVVILPTAGGSNAQMPGGFPREKQRIGTLVGRLSFQNSRSPSPQRKLKQAGGKKKQKSPGRVGRTFRGSKLASGALQVLEAPELQGAL